MPPKVIWFTTKAGGQVGVCRTNIKFLCSDFIMTKDNTRYELDPEKWVEHRLALVNGCL